MIPPLLRENVGFRRFWSGQAISMLGDQIALIALPLVAVLALDALTMVQLYAVAFATGTLSVFFFVSYSTLFTSIVPRERYIEANSLVHGSRALAYVAGPSIGGLLVQVLSAPIALLADAASFLGSALFLRRIDAPEPPTESAERGHIAAGARFIWRTPELRSSLASTAWINLFNFMFFALFILFATETLHVPVANATA